jgi:hypothetical protein
MSLDFNPPPVLSEGEAKALYDWEQAHRRKPDFPRGFPVQGFGAKGAITLWLAPASAKMETVFENGQPVMREAPGCLGDPGIRSSRDAVLKVMARTGPDRLYVGNRFLEYAAAVIRFSYDVNDEDLTLLLCSGDNWQNGIMHHILGGSDVVASLQALRENELYSPPVPSRVVVTDAPLLPVANPRKTYRQRLAEIFRR